MVGRGTSILPGPTIPCNAGFPSLTQQAKYHELTGSRTQGSKLRKDGTALSVHAEKGECHHIG
jgi:hypothetical protein